MDSEGFVVVEFYNKMCGACKMFEPALNKIIEDYPDIKFEKVEADANLALCEHIGVTLVPAIVFFNEGKMVFKYEGPLTGKICRELIEEHKPTQ